MKTYSEPLFSVLPFFPEGGFATSNNYWLDGENSSDDYSIASSSDEEFA